MRNKRNRKYNGTRKNDNGTSKNGKRTTEQVRTVEVTMVTRKKNVWLNKNSNRVHNTCKNNMNNNRMFSNQVLKFRKLNRIKKLERMGTVKKIRKVIRFIKLIISIRFMIYRSWQQVTRNS